MLLCAIDCSEYASVGKVFVKLSFHITAEEGCGWVSASRKTSASPGETLLRAHQNHNAPWHDCGAQLSERRSRLCGWRPLFNAAGL